MSEKKNKYIRQYKSVITKEILAKRLFGSDTKEKFDEMIKNGISIVECYSSFKDYGRCQIRYYINENIHLYYNHIIRNEEKNYIESKSHKVLGFKLTKQECRKLLN